MLRLSFIIVLIAMQPVHAGVAGKIAYALNPVSWRVAEQNRITQKVSICTQPYMQSPYMKTFREKLCNNNSNNV